MAEKRKPLKRHSPKARISHGARFGVTPEKIRRRLEYYRIGPDDVAAMAEIHSLIDPMIGSIIEVFYAHIGKFVSLNKIINDHSTVDALKKSLVRFIARLGTDMGSKAYVEERLQVGLVHCKIGLKPRWYLGAYSLLETFLHDIIAESCGTDMARYLRLTTTLRKVMMFDVSLGIDAYHLDSVAALETTLAKIKKHEQELRKTSRLDGLTGVMNRPSMMHAMKKELERSNRYSHSMSVLFIDLDHFKNINDTHGHAFGDKVLREVCETIRHTIRVPDILARYGGEEFVVILVECPEADAVMIAERIRRAIAGHLIQKRKLDVFIQVTASIGLYAHETADVSAQTILRHADRALYAAKKAGRNRVVTYSPDLDT